MLELQPCLTQLQAYNLASNWYNSTINFFSKSRVEVHERGRVEVELWKENHKQWIMVGASLLECGEPDGLLSREPFFQENILACLQERLIMAGGLDLFACS